MELDMWFWPVKNNGTLPVNASHLDNDNNDDDDDLGEVALFEGYPPPLLHLAAGCCALFILMGVPGNLITIVALFTCKKVRNATAVFIINLSVSDLMFCCFNLPLAASTFWARAWKYGPLLCRLFPLMRYGLLAVSLFTVLAITINRYVMIGHPTLYPKLYRKQWLGLMVAATWILGFGALTATWLGKWGRFGLDRQIGSCSIKPDSDGRSPKEFLFITAFLIPCLAISICYARIFYIVRRTARRSRNPPSGHSNGRGSGSSATGNSSATGAPSHSVISGGQNTTSRTSAASAYTDSNKRSSAEDSALSSCSGAGLTATVSTVELAITSGRRCGGGNGPREASSSSGVDCYDDFDTRSLTSTHHPSPRDRRESALGHVAAAVFRRRPTGASSVTPSGPPQPGKMSNKDKKLLKMILVIFSSFVLCYLPITITKTFHSALEVRALNIAGYILIYLTTCINPIIYVVMSSEYRQAYKNLLMCRSGAGGDPLAGVKAACKTIPTPPGVHIQKV